MKYNNHLAETLRGIAEAEKLAKELKELREKKDRQDAKSGPQSREAIA